ncbi:MAG TPA: hypothetical protein ENJ28_01190 [Gammaproteobacteria bacterium]|nr:hypothetical protein [Gammaproteobacteria bacterium]
MNTKILKCSFCCSPARSVNILIQSQYDKSKSICDKCVKEANEIMKAHNYSNDNKNK